MASQMKDARIARPHSRQARPSPVDGRPIIVATDTSVASDGALRAAQVIALHTLRPVQVIAAYDPPPLVVAEVAVVEPPEVDAERRELLRERVTQQFTRAGIMYDWPIETVCGDPAAVITRVAEEADAAIVIMGLSKHGLLERLFGEETVIRVLRLGSVPILAVSPDFARLPTRVLAATDFSASSTRALSLAGQLIHPFAAVTVAHVAPDDGDGTPSAFTDNGVMNGIHRAFDCLMAEASLPRSVAVERRVWPGEPATVLLDAARKESPDLVVVGSHGHGFLSRLMLGSVSRHLVRSAGTSILVAPPVNGPSCVEELAPSATRFTSYEWAERLEEFTRRNASRRASIEVIDPEIGAQVVQSGLPFTGASYDPRDGRVQIMLASETGSRRHVTHSLCGVTALQLMRDRAGRDLVLRMAQGRAQTLLTFDH